LIEGGEGGGGYLEIKCDWRKDDDADGEEGLNDDAENTALRCSNQFIAYIKRLQKLLIR
jgi:hypothetical protein